jgi:hypothetical protein
MNTGSLLQRKINIKAEHYYLNDEYWEFCFMLPDTLKWVIARLRAGIFSPLSS